MNRITGITLLSLTMLILYRFDYQAKYDATVARIEDMKKLVK
nr:hypothetical protein [Streptococcus lutetiensis]